MEKETIITQFISAWNWHILAMIFLTGSFIIISTSREFINLIFYVGLVIAFMISESFAYHRRRKIDKKEEYNEF
jgi:hypothetical protein